MSSTGIKQRRTTLTSDRRVRVTEHIVNGIVRLIAWRDGLGKHSVYEYRNGDKVILCRKGTSDQYVSEEMFSRTDIPWPKTKSPIIVDIGAHIGSFSIRAARECPGAKLIAIEPEPSNYHQLIENLKRNHIRAIAESTAIAKTPGMLILHRNSTNPGATSGIAQAPGDLISVHSTPLPDLLRRKNITRIDLLKIDVEGMEYEILLSLEKKILKSIQNLHLEYHDYFPGTHRKEELIALLKNAGFTVKIEKTILSSITKNGTIIATR